MRRRRFASLDRTSGSSGTLSFARTTAWSSSVSLVAACGTWPRGGAAGPGDPVSPSARRQRPLRVADEATRLPQPGVFGDGADAEPPQRRLASASGASAAVGRDLCRPVSRAPSTWRATGFMPEIQKGIPSDQYAELHGAPKQLYVRPARCAAPFAHEEAAGEAGADGGRFGEEARRTPRAPRRIRGNRRLSPGARAQTFRGAGLQRLRACLAGRVPRIGGRRLREVVDPRGT